MQIKLLKGKIHRATVTNANLDYEGSVAIDTDLMKSASIVPFEYVEIYNITNGKRFNTYAIEAEGGSGTISIQGAAAHKASKGDLVIICTYCTMDANKAEEHKPAIVLVDENNKVKN